MPSPFDLADFLGNPSVEALECFLKDDLVKIATHFGITFGGHTRKRELKSLIVTRLEELDLVTLSGRSALVTPKDKDDAARGAGECKPKVKTPFTLPRYDSSSPDGAAGSGEGARLKVRLARLELEAREKHEQAQRDLQLQIRKLEIEADTAVRIRQLELSAQQGGPSAGIAEDQHSGAPAAPPLSQHPAVFDISKYINLVPIFRESEVDAYFGVFERIASALQWPSEVWALLLQCKMHGKAQEAVSALSLEDSLKYDCVKAAILRVYELVPEAYRQKFRNLKKGTLCTHTEFAREKGLLFDKWIAACDAADYDSLRELILVEEFKKCLPERVVVYLNEQKVNTLSSAAVLADEYVLTHKFAFPVSSEGVSPTSVNSYRSCPAPAFQKEERCCFYCHKPGHVIADCLALKHKEQPKLSPPKGVGVVKVDIKSDGVEECFKPFVFDGWVSLVGDKNNCCPVHILRDTACSQSVILASVLPFSDKSTCGYDAILRGVEMGYVLRPVHKVHVQSELISGVFPVAVCPELPVGGVTFLMGNDIAGGKVTPTLEVANGPPPTDVTQPSSIFPSCVITRAQARKGEDINLSDSILMSAFADDPDRKADTQEAAETPESGASAVEEVPLPVDRARLGAEQKADPTLRQYFSRAMDATQVKGEGVYLMEDDLLLRRWPSVVSSSDQVLQVVIPAIYRPSILAMAHESVWSGHLGVRKTYRRILQHFFWPGIKADVANYCRHCHICQLTGKPNQKIPPAPLRPIPVVGEPFERVIVDCVGPLPRTKHGNQYLLTIMCAATRFPEAVPLRTITTRAIVKSLTKFFSIFGMPRVIQSDQGTNFLSKIFQQVLRTLNIQHVVSSAYHPESQGALERWHQTLKSMLRKYCLQTENDWDEGIPFLLFAAREANQESLGFSPAELVFGHTPRGPLKSLKDRFLAPPSPENVLDFVSCFRERLHRANELARKSLSAAQSTMKANYDRSAEPRQFHAGEQVLVLLPSPGATFSAHYSGPYAVTERLSETDYVVATPERRRKHRVCHINMLKKYFPRGAEAEPCKDIPVERCCIPITTEGTILKDDGLRVPPSAHLGARLSNSELLTRLPTLLPHLSPDQQRDVVSLFDRYSCLFQDVPTRTTVIEHDIDVGAARPIKQNPYRLNVTKREIMKTETDYLLQNGLAVPSSSPWSSPCLLEVKPDGSRRFVTDFRKVNKVTIPDSYPLPRMEDCVDNLGTAKYVTKLDLLKGYWQVPLTPRASDISAFVTPDHFLQYKVMAFGMCNAPATFQRLINTLLFDLKNCNAYLDDLIIHTSSWEEHVQVLGEVFARLAKASLTLNLAKCDFGKATVIYLGREVGQGQVRPVDAKISAIVGFPPPSTRKALRRFLGMAGYYRAFCRNFSAVVYPLTHLLSPSTAFTWTPECQHAFDSLKTLLTHAPVLAAPNFSKSFKLEVDASGVAAGAVLLQEDSEGIDHPVCYFSRKFAKHQINYSTIEKETLALLMALQHFEVYLGSSAVPVLVYTDHNPLTFLSSMYNHNQRLMRWALVIQDFNLEIRHKKGSDNVLADALSRV